ncbi:MAG TPA: hypothetical protein DCF33_10900 [Saprospirales bacterium]|nr:hypothetical protein [Saprospirales bacterium]
MDSLSKTCLITKIIISVPTTSTLQIQAPAPLEFVQVYDATGRAVLHSSTVGQEVSVAHLPAGLYFVSARAGGRLWGARFMKE